MNFIRVDSRDSRANTLFFFPLNMIEFKSIVLSFCGREIGKPRAEASGDEVFILRDVPHVNFISFAGGIRIRRKVVIHKFPQAGFPEQWIHGSICGNEDKIHVPFVQKFIPGGIVRRGFSVNAVLNDLLLSHEPAAEDIVPAVCKNLVIFRAEAPDQVSSIVDLVVHVASKPVGNNKIRLPHEIIAFI